MGFMSRFDAKFFDEAFYRGDKGPKRDWNSTNFVEFVGRVLGCVGGQKLSFLDVGCGMGYRTTNYLNAGEDVTGLEVSEWAVENSILPKGRILLGDVRKISKKMVKALFDVVILESVMGFIPKRDALSTIKKLAKVSKKYLVFAIMCKDHSNYAAISQTENPGRISVQTKKFWENTFKKAGLVINEGHTALMLQGGWDCIWFLEKK